MIKNVYSRNGFMTTNEYDTLWQAVESAVWDIKFNETGPYEIRSDDELLFDSRAILDLYSEYFGEGGANREALKQRLEQPE